MMKKIEAPTLEEAYTQAREALGCSITDLDFEIVQNPSKGFLGLFKKNAIIVASCKQLQSTPTPEVIDTKEEVIQAAPEPKVTTLDPQITSSKPETIPTPKESQETNKTSINTDIDGIVDVFDKESGDSVLEEIRTGLHQLFDKSCFNLDAIDVSFYDEKTVRIHFDGPDAALLIGKEGYRYKALSYMLFNWINPKYNLLLRLEIAEFLQNQEEYIRRYLEPLIANIDRHGRGQTKILDGVLVQIALKELRAAFPDKYVAIKSTFSGEKYIVVNEFNHR